MLGRGRLYLGCARFLVVEGGVLPQEAPDRVALLAVDLGFREQLEIDSVFRHHEFLNLSWEGGIVRDNLENVRSEQM